MEPRDHGGDQISYFRVAPSLKRVSEGPTTGKFELEMGEIVSGLELELGDPQKFIFFNRLGKKLIDFICFSKTFFFTVAHLEIISRRLPV